MNSWTGYKCLKLINLVGLSVLKGLTSGKPAFRRNALIGCLLVPPVANHTGWGSQVYLTILVWTKRPSRHNVHNLSESGIVLH